MRVRFETNHFPGPCIVCAALVEIGTSKVYQMTKKERQALGRRKCHGGFALKHEYCNFKPEASA